MNTKAVRDLKELGPAYAESLVPRPKRINISEEGIEDERAVLRIIREEAQQTREWARTNLAVLAERREKPRDLQERKAKDTAEFEQNYAEAMEDETQSFRRACWVGTFEQRLSVTVSLWPEAEAVMDNLVHENLLERAADGAFNVFEKRYRVPGRAAFAEPTNDVFGRLINGGLIREVPRGGVFLVAGKRYTTVQQNAEKKEKKEKKEGQEIDENYELGRALEDFSRRFRQAEEEAKKGQDLVLFGKSELSLDEFLTNTPGRITLGIPPEPLFRANGAPVMKRDGVTPKWSWGGNLLFESDGGDKIFPRAASGSIQSIVDKAVSLNIFVLRYTLEWNFIKCPLGFSQEKFRALVDIWGMLKRGIASAKREQEAEKFRDEMIASVDNVIPPERFFLLKERGFCLAEYDELWKHPGQEGEKPLYIPGLYFLVERFVQGEGDEAVSFVRLVATPGHINGYLDACSGDYPEGESFSGVAQPLQMVLRAIHTKISRAAQAAANYGPKK